MRCLHNEAMLDFFRSIVIDYFHRFLCFICQLDHILDIFLIVTGYRTSCSAWASSTNIASRGLQCDSMCPKVQFP